MIFYALKVQALRSITPRRVFNMIKNTKDIVTFVMKCLADKKNYWKPKLAGKQFDEEAAAGALTVEMTPYVHRLCYKYAIQELENNIKNRQEMLEQLKNRPEDTYWTAIRFAKDRDIEYLKERLAKNKAALLELLESHV